MIWWFDLIGFFMFVWLIGVNFRVLLKVVIGRIDVCVLNLLLLVKY